MGSVVQLVSLSDKGRALCAIEAERSTLYAEACRVSDAQQQIMAGACATVAELGKQHELIVKKIAALDDASAKVCG